MNDHDPTQFSAALRERVRDEDPDLDQLIQVSTRTGTRMRRRRTVGISLAGAAAGVAVIGIVGVSLGGSGTTGSEPDIASQPTAPASASAPGDVSGTLTNMDRSHADDFNDLVNMKSLNAGDGHDQQLPIRLEPRSLGGWAIGSPADDKFSASLGKNVLSVNVRPMSERAAWSGGDPDRPANQVVHVGDNYFVTVQPGRDVSQGVVDELVAGLRFKPTWRR